MASNTLLTIDMITKEALRLFVNNLGFTKTINREYDSSFAQSGAKIGTTLRIRKPARVVPAAGPAYSQQNFYEDYTNLTVNTQQFVGLQFTSSEMTMSLDDFSNRVLSPAMVALANKVDLDGLALYSSIYNQVGTAGSTPSTITAILQAGQKLNENACPIDGNRYVCLNPAGEAGMVAGLSGLFNDSATVGQQYVRGQMGRGLGFNFLMDQNVASHTTGGRATATSLTVTDVATDSSVVKIKTDAGTWAFVAGDVISFASVNAVNPLTYASTGSAKQFVITAATIATTTGVNVSISPAITTSNANGLKNVTALPADGAAVTFSSGSAATAYAQNLAYHKEAFCLATADLEIPQGVDMASRAAMDGVSLRIVRAYDPRSDAFITRADVLYGWAAVRPEWACRITG